MSQSDARGQTTNDVFLVRPANFGPNSQTAASNAFQQSPGQQKSSALHAAALAEFDGMVNSLRSSGVNAIVFADTSTPAKPDAIFPNNWITTHADGTVLLYPMEAENRRLERRGDIVERLSAEYHFHVTAITDLSALESRGKFLEGTGSLVLDRLHRQAYAALSSRTDPQALAEFAQRAGYEITAFATAGAHGRPVYHTNVMMSMGTGFAIVCADLIGNADERRAVLRRIADTGRQLIEISPAQAANFAGNIIELQSQGGDAIIAMSHNAHDSLSDEQLNTLGRFGRTLVLPIDTIEKIGGGGVRCMLAEIFLPRSIDS